MQFLTIKNAFVALTAFAVLGASQIINSTLEWTNDAGNITLYGDATEIMAQLKILDPGFAAKVVSPDHQSNSRATCGGPYLTGGFCCPVNDFVPQPPAAVEKAITILVAQQGTYSLAANQCNVAMASGNSAIWMCNSGGTTVYPSLCYIGQIAENIMNDCGPDSAGKICGQWFTSDNWNVVVSLTDGGDHP